MTRPAHHRNPDDQVADGKTGETANIAGFLKWLNDTGRCDAQDFGALWAASVHDIDAFWDWIWRYFRIDAATPATAILGSREMPGAQWFPGASLNYAQHVFRNATTDRQAMVVVAENGASAWSWARLMREAGSFAAYLRELGVIPGDRVVGYLPNIGEAVAAFLGAAAVGAVWAVCNQDFGEASVIARLRQLDPVVLVVADGSVYGGREHDRRDVVTKIADALPTLRATVMVERLGSSGAREASWDVIVSREAELQTTPVPFSHPLWVLFSSGTTGSPKGIVHGHGGIVLEHLKFLGLHLDLRPDDRYFWHASTSWVMWNLLVSGLMLGSTIVLYDGSPTYPHTDRLWQIVDEHHVTVFGTSAAYLLGCAKENLQVGQKFELSALRTVGSTGSPLPAAGYRWVHDYVHPHIPVNSVSGGTDIASAFVGGCPLLPVIPGEISGPCLGVSAQAWTDQGRPIVGSQGELVVTQPMPSMPLYMWNDPDGERYRGAYFDGAQGVWSHGDWITITDRNTIIVHGRSDATLNRLGVRMGSAEIYQALESVPEVSDCLAVGVELADGGYWLPLFVHLLDGVDLTEDLRARIVNAVRDNASPRHVPDEIIQVSGIPRTMTGKKLEIPVKRILLGTAPSEAVDLGAVDQPGLLDEFAAFARTPSATR
ncbi:acetoacetate--CoA ligase [Mycobacterium marseillense]|uniref:Acetoacetate-CoA ligase n=1 Tax=Mycobacterium [tuberculosis] TKK-01-0051 TaxID=1324261 RepID=A0A051TWM4_9MYCO|nr:MULTISPECIES: acetoacetate--CoA ligase [Mycobacterium avium complex (MAC)]KBZ61043.1 acetoacetate-CoA ligase [Mycobacterium [tuberculosis] TKK-01-0051]MDM3973518.1 acetoacetate--CoA ligase [Mycobacterium marseillense]